MKRFFIYITLMAVALSAGRAYAQTSSDNGLVGQGITLGVIIPEQTDPFPTGAEAYLTNKLIQVAVTNGIAAGKEFSRFFIAANIAMATKDIVAGPPSQISQNVELTLYIADYFDHKIFSSTVVNAVGVGTNETKSFINALQNLPVASPVLQEFVEKGKTKILDYYRQQGDRVIQQARVLAAQHRYEEALFHLTAIPDATGDVYDRALQATLQIFKQYTDHMCDVNLGKARSAWAAQQNSTGAAEAGQYLALIYPDAECYGDAMGLYGEIKGKVLDDWKFEMKKWQDGVDLESQRISAARDIGVAWGNGQQPTTFLMNWLR